MNSNSDNFRIRKGTETDLPQAIDLIIELARHEGSLTEMEVSPEQLQKDGSGETPLFEFLVADAGNEMVGLAVFFYTYSTWKGKQLYLEDLVVKQSHRGKGIGHALLEEIKAEARSRNATHVMWQAHDYNQAALDFYQRMGATFSRNWVNCILKV